MGGLLPLFIALLWPDQDAQPQLPMISVEAGVPIVRTIEPVTPPFDPSRERVVFFVYPVENVEEDLPFLYNREGLVVRTENIDLYTAEYAVPGRVVLLVCRATPSFGNNSAEGRARICEVRQ